MHWTANVSKINVFKEAKLQRQFITDIRKKAVLNFWQIMRSDKLKQVMTAEEINGLKNKQRQQKDSWQPFVMVQDGATT